MFWVTHQISFPDLGHPNQLLFRSPESPIIDKSRDELIITTLMEGNILVYLAGKKNFER